MINDNSHKVVVLIREDEIKQIIDKLATTIIADLDGEDLVVVGVLDGAYAFLTDLTRAMYAKGMKNLIVDFVGIDTYGSGTTSSKEAKITKDLKHDIRGKVVLIVDDIIDTGFSMNVLQSLLKSRQPKKLVTAALLSKDSRREVTVPVEYIGKQIPDVFVVGYGLDYDGKYYRELPFIGVVTK